MKIICQVVVRNEAGRYWDSWLKWHMPIFDQIHIYDDASIDQTGHMALQAGATVSVAPIHSFLEHEGLCRQSAWCQMEGALAPSPDDWIFTLDADEFVVGDFRQAIKKAAEKNFEAIQIPIPEVFDIQNGIIETFEIM